MSSFKIVVQLTGSISCYKACNLISMLVKDGCQVQCIASNAALEFIGRATLEGLTERSLLTGMFKPKTNKDHINLTKWADLFLLCPATGNSINRLANGLADDLIGATFLANNFKKPYWIAPAMNSGMLEHPATVKSIETLSQWGAYVFPTEEGILACGDIGKGRLLAPEIIFEKIKKEIT